MPETGSHGDVAEETLAGRRQPHKEPPTLDHAESPSHHRSSTDEGSLRSVKLRVVNETRDRIASDASIPADLQSSSTIPYGWTAREFEEDKDKKSRWRESVDSQNRTNSSAPSSFRDRTTDILVKLRLLPVMKALQNPKDKVGLSDALKRAETILNFAVKANAPSALQGRCCYYIGVAMYLLGEEEAEQYFVGALDAKGVYEEGTWAKQWANHYDSLGELSPNRIAASERPVSWTGEPIGNYMSSEKKKYVGSSILSSQAAGSAEELKSPATPRNRHGKGIQSTTPVRERFSLDTRDDHHDERSFGSQTPGSKGDSSIAGGESIQSFSTWNSSPSPSETLDPTRPVLVTDGLHSPKCAHVSPTSQSDGAGEDQLTPTVLDSSVFSPQHKRSKSVTFSTAPPVADAGPEGTLASGRRQSSRFHVNAPSVLKKVNELSISPTDDKELPKKEPPPASYAEAEQEF